MSNNYGKLAERILGEMGRKEAAGRVEEGFHQLLNELKLSHQEIAAQESSALTKSVTYRLFSKIIELNAPNLYNFFRDLL